MNAETDLEKLERRVQKAKTLVHESEMKVEELVAQVHEAEKLNVKIRHPDKPVFPATSPADPALLD